MSAPARRRLRDALASLDARTRTVVALARLDGLTPAEIAVLLGATPGQVTRTLALAERVLRAAASEPRRRRA